MTERHRDLDDLTVSEADALAIVDYLDGHLESTERIELEMRLSEEPELAAAFDTFAQIDDLARRVELARRKKRRFRFLRGGWALGVLAAAAAILVIGGGISGLFDSGGSPLSRRLNVAILPSGSTVLDFNAALGVSAEHAEDYPESWLPVRRGDAEPLESVPNEEYRQLLLPILNERARASLSGELAPGEPLTFLLPIEVEAPTSVIVLLIDERGETMGIEGEPFQVAYPFAQPWSAASGRLEAGLTILPYDPTAPLEEPADEPGDRVFQGGFVTPFLGGATTVLVASRAEPFDEGLRASLMERLAEIEGTEVDQRNTTTRLRAWSSQHGFEVVELTVSGE